MARLRKKRSVHRSPAEATGAARTLRGSSGSPPSPSRAMDLSNKTILVTGGATGIGLAFASRFLAAGSRVIICGRRESALRAAAEVLPGLVTRACDLEREDDRVALVEWVTKDPPPLDVLVNNAGVQRRIRPDESEPWVETRRELAINLDAPIHLALALLP